MLTKQNCRDRHGFLVCSSRGQEVKCQCAVDYIFNLLCAFNSRQPNKKFVFSVASLRATGSLQIKPSGSGDESALDMSPYQEFDQKP